MADVSREFGAGLHKRCSFKTGRAFLLTTRPYVGVFGACLSLRMSEKTTEGAQNTGSQTRRTSCTLLIQSPPARLIINRSHYTNPSQHTNKTVYYDILRVSPNATQAQIKTAYYRQSFRYHPDRNSGSAESVRRFTEISEAYTVLGSMSLRRKYDSGVLSLEDVLNARRPSGKDTGHRQEQPWRFRTVPGPGDRPMFDFDAFYRAHYGEQLDREQNVRRWRELRQRTQQENIRKWKLERGTEVAVGALLAVGTILLFNLKS